MISSWIRGVLLLATLVGAAVQADVRVIDGDTLDVDGVRHRLFGIDAAERQQTCRDVAGVPWTCAAAATAALQQWAERGRMVCTEVPGTRDAYRRLISRCRVNGVDVGEDLVAQGLAWAFRRYSADYIDAESRARGRHLGVWSVAPGAEPNTPPWVWRSALRARQQLARAAQPDTAPDPDCRIKGNISASGRIYHVPGSSGYARTRISGQRGERWFCSEAAARAAGWRAPRGERSGQDSGQ